MPRIHRRLRPVTRRRRAARLLAATLALFGGAAAVTTPARAADYSATNSHPEFVQAYDPSTVPVSSIRHSTDLRYKSFIWWKKATTKSGGNSGVASYTQRNVEYRCVSNESSGWSGTTFGTISHGGKKYYARVYQPARTLACGG